MKLKHDFQDDVVLHLSLSLHRPTDCRDPSTLFNNPVLINKIELRKCTLKIFLRSFIHYQCGGVCFSFKSHMQS